MRKKRSDSRLQCCSDFYQIRSMGSTESACEIWFGLEKKKFSNSQWFWFIWRHNIWIKSSMHQLLLVRRIPSHGRQSLITCHQISSLSMPQKQIYLPDIISIYFASYQIESPNRPQVMADSWPTYHSTNRQLETWKVVLKNIRLLLCTM